VSQFPYDKDYASKARNRMQKLHDMGVPFGEAIIRRTGRSTGCALKLLGMAMMRPNCEIVVLDHFVSSRGIPTHNQITLHLCSDIAEYLGLSGFQYKKQHSRSRIIYKLTDEPHEWSEK